MPTDSHIRPQLRIFRLRQCKSRLGALPSFEADTVDGGNAQKSGQFADSLANRSNRPSRKFPISGGPSALDTNRNSKDLCSWAYRKEVDNFAQPKSLKWYNHGCGRVC